MDFETFAINIYEEPPQALLLRLAGEFDLVCEQALQEALDDFCGGSGRSLVVDLSEASFMGVGCLRRIVLAGRGFAWTEFRSPLPIVEKMLRILEFVDGPVEIEGGTSPPVAPSRSDDVASLGRCDETTRIGPENERPGSQVSRQCLGATGLLKHRIVGPGGSDIPAAAGQDAHSSQRSLERK